MVGVTTDALARWRGPNATRSRLLAATRAQLGTAGAQWIAGLGNLVFALVLARLLAPGDFAALGAFLGAYVLLHLPAAGIGAAAALAPGDHRRLRRRLGAAGAGVAILLVASAPWASSAFGVPAAMVVALAAAAPGAALLGLERGVLFHHRRRRSIASTLLSEPAVRLLLGVGAAVLVGPTGAAFAVTAAGYAALVAAMRGGDLAPAARPLAARSPGASTATAATFALFAVIQQQDLLFAKARLGTEAAGAFAALSTVGGAVAFATATIPLALLPEARNDDAARRAAVAITVCVGAAAVLVATVAGDRGLALVVGDGYRTTVPQLAAYVGAMGLLGVGRVLAAGRCARDDHRRVVTAAIGAAVLHTVLLAFVGTSTGSIVGATTAATAAAATVLAVPDGAAGRLGRRWRVAVARWASTRDLVLVTALTAVATVVRVVSTRGLWVDEAITVAQAKLPFGAMLEQLQTTDVHPPLHHALIWVLVRVAGTGELVVRAPSIVAGALLVPATFGLANALYGRRTGLVASAFVTIAPFAVWYSQEARMYSLFMLLATLSFWAQVTAIRGDGRWAWAAYVVSTAAMAWTQWFAIVPIAAQQLVFAGVWFRRRHDRTQRRRFLLVWAAALGASLVLVLPLLPLAMDQLGAYAGRRAATTAAPSQAGAAASGLAGDVSVYAVGANAIWAVLGYHADTVMTQLAALWPLLLLVGFGALGRGRSDRTTALLVCIAAPTLAFIAAGLVKRDLFELRYFAGAVPLVLVLGARAVTVVFRRSRTQFAAAGVAVAILAAGLVDQQLNGANPRRYDFEGALDRITAEAGPDDVVLYEPDYLAEVVEYYAPGVTARSIDARDTVPDGTRTWVLATTRVANDEVTSARVGDALADLEAERTVVDRFAVPNVRVWELRS